MDRFRPFAEKMRRAGMPELAVESFRHYFQCLEAGETGRLSEQEIKPVDDLPAMEDLPRDLEAAGRQALDSTILLKLNGGLGTSMGLDQAKSLLPIRGDLTFLDIIARRAVALGTPLLLMNSFATDRDTRERLADYPELTAGDLPLTFLQHRVPKIVRKTLEPALFPENPDLEWCPPGHGDLYSALVTSGMLSRLLESGMRYAFVSNSDNLGADLDLRILGHLVSTGTPFLMEVARRTPADRKGGHLARWADGSDGFVLRESAQCPAEDRAAFQSVDRHRFFNTNNLWVDLRALEGQFESGRSFLRLPMIRNEKTLDPQNPHSTPVYQLESAMGAAISVFEGAGAIVVPRHRFAPVKTCNDLLVARSDAMVLTEDYRLVPNPERSPETPVVELDRRHYRLISDLEERFPQGPPSMMECVSLQVSGDFRFDARPRLIGAVRLENRTGSQVVITGDQEIEGHRNFE